MKKTIDPQHRTLAYGIMLGWVFTAAMSWMLWSVCSDARALSPEMAAPIAAILLIGLATVIGQLLAAGIYKLRGQTGKDLTRKPESAYFLFITMALCPMIIIMWLYSGVSLFMSVGLQRVLGPTLYAEREIIVHVELFWAVMLQISVYIVVLTVIWLIVSWFLYKLIIKNWVKKQSINPITLIVFVVVGFAAIMVMNVLVKLLYGFFIYENFAAYGAKQVEVYASLFLGVWIVCMSLSKRIERNE